MDHIIVHGDAPWLSRANPRTCQRDNRWITVLQASLGAWLFATERTGSVATYLAFHEVDDVQHWLSSPKREEIFGPMGITARTFHDPEGSKRVGLIVEIPDMAAFQEFMQSDAAAEAMKYDGVHPETLLILSEG
jgi:hypothetical protein